MPVLATSALKKAFLINKIKVDTLSFACTLDIQHAKEGTFYFISINTSLVVLKVLEIFTITQTHRLSIQS